MTQPYDDKLWKMAQKRVSFRRHLIVYILVNIALIVIWYVSRDTSATKDTNAMTYWFLYPLCGWGIGLVIHYWNAFHDDDASIEKEYLKIKQRIERRAINETDQSTIQNPDEKQL